MEFYLDKLFQILKDDAVKVLHSVCQQTWKTQQWPQDWKRSGFTPISNKDNAKECSNYHTVILISLASKVIFKILQIGLFQYMNQKLPDVQDGFRKGRGIRDQVATIQWIIEKSKRLPGKKSTSASLTTLKPLTAWDHNKMWKILIEMGIPNHLTCLLGNLNVGQEARVRTRYGTMDWFKIGNGVHQGCILSPCLFNLYAEFSSVAQSCLTLCDPMDCSTPGLLSITNSHSLLKLMSIESVMPSNHLIICRPLLLLSVFPSIRVFFP